MLDRADIVREIDSRGAAVRRLDVITLFGGAADVGVTHLQVSHLTGDINRTGDDLFGCFLVGDEDRTCLTGVDHLPTVAVFVGLDLGLVQQGFLLGTHFAGPGVLQQDSLLGQVLNNTVQIDGLGVRQVSGMRITRTDSTAVLNHRLKEQVLSSVETLERIAQFVTYVCTTLFFDLSHLCIVVQQGIHSVEVERPRVDVRVDVVRTGRSVEEGLALLPMLTHQSPSRISFYHQVSIVLTGFHFGQDSFSLTEQRHAGIGHLAVGSYNGVVYIRCYCFLQRSLLVGSNCCVAFATD